MLSADQRCNFVKKISVTISWHVRWSSYPGPSPQPDAQIVFSWFIYMTLMKSLLWLDYSVHQGFSADVRELPEFFVFLHDLPPFSLSKQIILLLLNISNSGLFEWLNQTLVLHFSLHPVTLLSQEFHPWLSVEHLHHPSALPQSSSVQFSHSVVPDSVNPWTAARQASLSIREYNVSSSK